MSGQNKMPEFLKYTSADTVAECWDYHKFMTKDAASDLCRKLWGFLSEAAERGKATPLGGDGSNGTREWPELTSHEEDKGSHWWHRLTDEEQLVLIKCDEQWG